MLLDDGVLGGRQAARFAQDGIGDADLADIVQEAGDVYGPDELRVEAKAFGQEDGVSGDILGMPLRVAVLRVDGNHEALQNVEAGRRYLFLSVFAGNADGIPAARLCLLEGARGRRQKHGDGCAVFGIGAQPGTDRHGQSFGGLELEAQVDQGSPDPLDGGLEIHDIPGPGDK